MAIIGILAAGPAAYQDYTVRARVSEAFGRCFCCKINGAKRALPWQPDGMTRLATAWVVTIAHSHTRVTITSEWCIASGNRCLIM